MKILFLTQVLPYPLDAGPKIRAYYVARHLASAGHEVTLLSFIRSEDRPQHIDHLQEFCARVETVLMARSKIRDAYHLARALVRGLPFVICRDENAAMVQKIRQLVREDSYDAVHSDQLWMAPYALLAGEEKRPMLVLDQHNAVFQIPDRLARTESNALKRALLRREALRLFDFERAMCDRFDQVIWVTAEDRRALNAGEPERTRHDVIPICVDPESQPLSPRSFRARRITFLGGLHWPPNAQGVLWFARNVWPEVHRREPEAKLTIIGRNPPKELGELDAGGIEITGYVSDVEPYLKETAAFIVPLHAGGGMRVKILDAWCRGLPVISTAIGAEGIRVRDGENCMIADTPKGFAEAVCRVLREWWLAERLSRCGRQTVETEYNWRGAYQKWDRAYGDGRPQPRRASEPMAVAGAGEWIQGAKAR
jgi:polysaccharide biosynthesis protein PslH